MPRTIDPTGRRDVTRALQSFIDRAPDGSTIELVARARYRVDGTLLLGNRHNLVVLGNGATIFASTRGNADRSQWWVKDGSHLAFRDLRVDGANPHAGTGDAAYVRDLETQHGFRIEGTDGIELDRVTVNDTFGDFVYLGRDAKKRPTRNAWIHDCEFARNGRQGIAVTAANGVVIERNHISDTRRATIDLEPNGKSWHIDNVFVLDNTVGPGRLLFIASKGQGPVNGVVIARNRLVGHTLTITVVPPGNRRRQNWVVSDNVSDATVKSQPLRFAQIDGLVVSGNREPTQGLGTAISVVHVCGDRVVGNDFGRAGVRRVGPQCNARLRVPVPPRFAGRSATSVVPSIPRATSGGSAATAHRAPGRHSRTPLVALVAILAVATITVVVWRRRRRSARTHSP